MTDFGFYRFRNEFGMTDACLQPALRRSRSKLRCEFQGPDDSFYRSRVGARNDETFTDPESTFVASACGCGAAFGMTGFGERAGWERHAEYRVSNCSLVIGVFWS